MSMKSTQKPSFRAATACLAGTAVALGLAASVNAQPATVTDITDWSTTPMEVVNITDPYLGYNGGVYAGINTLAVTVGSSTTVYDGFCIDPFHWSLSGPQPYNIVPLASAPKPPGALNASTALQIEDLWAEFYSPTMSSSGAAGLQIAIWDLVSSNAVATGELPANQTFSLANGQGDYGASADIASLATYTGPAANLEGLTGPGQDYVIDIPSPPSSAPDGGATFIMLALTAGALIVPRPALLQCAGRRLKAVTISPTRGQ